MKIDMSSDLLSGTECDQGLWCFGDEETSCEDRSCRWVVTYSVDGWKKESHQQQSGGLSKQLHS